MGTFFAGKFSEKYSQLAFFFITGFLSTAIGVITFVLLLLRVRKRVKEGALTKENAQKMYLISNSILGFGTVHYVFGIICLILSGLKVIIMPLFDLFPKGIIGGTVATILFVGWVFVLPMYLVGKMPAWLKEILNKL